MFCAQNCYYIATDTCVTHRTDAKVSDCTYSVHYLLWYFHTTHNIQVLNKSQSSKELESKILSKKMLQDPP